MLKKLVQPPQVSEGHSLPTPGDTSIVLVGAEDTGVLAVTGVLQCTAIFFYNPNNKKRLAAHFGGLSGSRAPKTGDLKKFWEALLGEQGGDRIEVTLCKNSNTPNSLQTIDEAKSQVQELSSLIKINEEEYATSSFYMFSDGGLFVASTPETKPKPTFTMGSRRKPVDENK